MNLYIQIKDGNPINHPVLEDNLIQAFPGIDLNNLPDNFARFERVPNPPLGIYEVNEGTTYEWVDGIVKDVHHIRELSLEEKIAQQDAVKNNWQQYNGFASWIFNAETCRFDPPVPYPEDGNFYEWDEPTLSWVERTINT